jgi:hypothetical protein
LAPLFVWLFFFHPAETRRYTYWIAPCARPTAACQPGDPELARWAMEAWQNASGGALRLRRTEVREQSRIRVLWASAEEGLYGEARPIAVNGAAGAEVFVRPAPSDPRGDRLLRDAIVYLTCVHETGHALGLAHTADFADIMYSFQYGGDIPEYFARYRRQLRTRADIAKNAGISDGDRNQLRAILSR